MRGAMLLCAFLPACALPAFARTGEITERRVVTEAALPIVSHEPQEALDQNGVHSKSSIAFFPLPLVDVRTRVSSRCEVGIDLSPRFGGELRCGVVQESAGDVVSLAPSIATTINPSPFGPWLRVGFDASKRLGILAPILDAYLSYGPEWHYVVRTVSVRGDPWEGPLPLATSTRRRELRAVLPFGVAIRVSDGDAFDARVDLVVGATAWWVLRSTDLETSAVWYDAERALTFTVGVQVESPK